MIAAGSLPKTWHWQSGSSQSISPSLSLSIRSVQISCSWQVDEQPSPFAVLPSSHCSPCGPVDDAVAAARKGAVGLAAVTVDVVAIVALLAARLNAVAAARRGAVV